MGFELNIENKLIMDFDSERCHIHMNETFDKFLLVSPKGMTSSNLLLTLVINGKPQLVENVSCFYVEGGT